MTKQKQYIDRTALLRQAETMFDGQREVMGVKAEHIYSAPVAEVAEVVHGRCPVCNGEKVIMQDCDNGVYVEVDFEQQEMSVWQGDECIAVFSIDYCPHCGAKMDGGERE